MMKLVPKHDIFDEMNPRVKMFTKNEPYYVEGVAKADGTEAYMVSDNQRIRNYISVGGEFIQNFNIG